MTAVRNLWPNFLTEARPRGTRQILEEVGAGLGERTGDLVHFRVRPLLPHDEDKFRYDCILHLPRADYGFPLCRVVTGPAPFPADLIWEGGTVTGINSEQELVDHLSAVFNDLRTKEVILNLMSLVT
jgi:hypothetical protein